MSEKRASSPGKKGRKKSDKQKVEEVIEEQEPVPIEPTSGVFVFPSGATYDGQVMNFPEKGLMRHGKGIFVDGPVRYEGDWVEDVMEGEGFFTREGGSSYQGSFKHNTYNGEGTYTWPDGATYTGGWLDGKMHGRGKYISEKGVEWQGVFYNGSGPELVRPVLAPTQKSE
ncbi:putative 1-phosphatidylinositol-4-phosphate 5-kinase [Monocercomonoides exilis]|uniref:putative 1-phosphatidylinositol-4-phosphate 5-kinase n=1 Tax=Monocercomonoides exilis TaxID=2049356 RepID=UPI003559B7FD|nr:putative 1-phosphatidylinositol-4-phosphate 5-kinase [Monocercomonoides exilis]